MLNKFKGVDSSVEFLISETVLLRRAQSSEGNQQRRNHHVPISFQSASIHRPNQRLAQKIPTVPISFQSASIHRPNHQKIPTLEHAHQVPISFRPASIRRPNHQKIPTLEHAGGRIQLGPISRVRHLDPLAQTSL